jgi:hypothetical protein
MATDRWAGYMILNKPRPYHPLGLPQPGFTPADAAALGIDLDAGQPARTIAARPGHRKQPQPPGHPQPRQISRERDPPPEEASFVGVLTSRQPNTRHLSMPNSYKANARG